MKLYVFDVDGTLVERYGLEPLPGVREWFEKWDAGEMPGVRVAFATNQGGVGCRRNVLSGIWDGDADKYPTQEQVESRLESLATRLAPNRADEILKLAAYYYPAGYPLRKDTPNMQREHGPEWRKPNPGMILEAMRLYRSRPSDTVMVGDSGDDRVAADNAGVRFIEAGEFFLGSVPEEIDYSLEARVCAIVAIGVLNSEKVVTAVNESVAADVAANAGHAFADAAHVAADAAGDAETTAKKRSFYIMALACQRAAESAAANALHYAEFARKMG